MSYTATYSSATIFTVSGDKTSEFTLNRRLRCYCGATDGYKYGWVGASTHAGGTTTVTLSHDSQDLTSNLATVEYGVVASSSTGSDPRSDFTSGYYAVDSSAADQGATTSSGRSVYDLLTAIGTTKYATLYFPHHAASGTTTAYTVSTDEVTTSNITCEFQPGAVLSVDSTKTFTIHSPEHVVANPRQQIKSGAGTLAWTTGGIVYPQWWGAVADWNGTTGTDDITAINAAIDSLEDKGGIVRIYGRMKHGTPVVMKAVVNLEGIPSRRSSPRDAPDAQLYNSGTGVAITVADTQNPDIQIRDLYIEGQSTSSHGIDIDNVYDGAIYNCEIQGHGGNGIDASHSASWKIQGNHIHANEGYGLKTGADTNGWNIIGNHIQTNQLAGVYADSWWGVTFSGNTVEGNASSDPGGTDDAEMTIRSLHSSTIHGNYFEGGATMTMYFGLAIRGVSIMGNYFGGSPTTTSAVFLTEATREIEGLIIQGNTFKLLTNGVQVNAGGTEVSNCIFGPNYFWSQSDSYVTINRYKIDGTLRNTVIYDDQATKWLADTDYSIGHTCLNDSGKVYVCVTAGESDSSGGPTGTGSGIQDNDAYWDYQAPRQYFETHYGHKILEGGIVKTRYRTDGSWSYAYRREGYMGSLADAGEDDTEVATVGLVFISTTDGEHGLFNITTTATVAIDVSANVTITKDTGSKWNVYVTSGTIRVQNNTGTARGYTLFAITGLG